MIAPDRIEKHIVLQAPVSRVWRALTDAEEFGAWFGVELDGPFLEGREVRGTFTFSLDEAEIVEFQKSLGVSPSGVKMPEPHSLFGVVERIEPEHYFSYRWHPYGLDAEADLPNEPMTLVEFRLDAVPEGTRLTVTESGFERVPAHRRLRAFRMNDDGWASQLENVARHVSGA